MGGAGNNNRHAGVAVSRAIDRGDLHRTAVGTRCAMQSRLGISLSTSSERGRTDGDALRMIAQSAAFHHNVAAEVSNLDGPRDDLGEAFTEVDYLVAARRTSVVDPHPAVDAARAKHVTAHDVYEGISKRPVALFKRVKGLQLATRASRLGVYASSPRV